LGANLAGADLRAADLTHAYFDAGDLSGATLTHANLTDVNFSASDLTGADLSRTDLSKVSFSCGGSPPVCNNLSGSHLDGADLRGVNLLAVNGLTQGQIYSAITDAKRSYRPDSSAMTDGSTRKGK
jgi:uncharacterized protein YjbI with pentapeptide repeats